MAYTQQVAIGLSINAPVFFKYIQTILSVFFSFIVIRFYFIKISTCTCPKTVPIQIFKVDRVTKSFVHIRSCAFSRTANSQKMREDKNAGDSWSLYLLLFRRVQGFDISRFKISIHCKTTSYRYEKFTFQQVYKIALMLRLHKYDGLHEIDGLHENDGLIS